MAILAFNGTQPAMVWPTSTQVHTSLPMQPYHHQCGFTLTLAMHLMWWLSFGFVRFYCVIVQSVQRCDSQLIKSNKIQSKLARQKWEKMKVTKFFSYELDLLKCLLVLVCLWLSCLFQCCLFMQSFWINSNSSIGLRFYFGLPSFLSLCFTLFTVIIIFANLILANQIIHFFPY